MPSESGRPYLSETIDYDIDIEPYQFIKIYAGVGSGKNFFVDNLVKGNVFTHTDGSFVKRKYVLLFTSRRSKANEQINHKKVTYDKTIGAFDELEYYFKDDAIAEYETSETYMLPDLGGFCGREIKLRSCSCTNAQAEKACSDYIPKEPFTHPWERFDFIVIDEVHSILSDANYQSAPFYIQSLLEEIKLRAPKCKVIVMTGSPEIIRDYPLFEDYHLIDRMDVCDNLTPKSVKFISKKKAQNILRQCITDNKKAVYFCNRIDDIVKTAVKLSLDTHACIVPSFSNEDKRRKLKKEHLGLFNAMEDAETTLATQCMLPENIILFLTNARNKEGINIKNADIKTMLVDAHAEVDIKQMAGRVRKLLDELYIVVDATSFDDNDLAGELGFSQNSELLGTVNSYLKKLAEDVKYTFGPHDNINHKQILQDYVSFIHEKFPYLRYNYFKNTFVFYMQRQISKEYYDTQNELFSTHLTSQGFKELSQNWFPDALCVVEFYTDEKNKAIVDQYIEDHNLLDKRLHRKDEQIILMHLSELTNTAYKKLGNLLRRYGYRKVPRGKNAIGDWIIVHK